ncbi:hypothetical protein [Massilia orientalis]|uniref:Uncharacterized protein n=1 Tax=Massilia orientalis TaxID=3050128 RepID=A0ACC7MDR4_9BURK|nr:hypothetical protein [Massilia sp. YIM B02787]
MNLRIATFGGLDKLYARDLLKIFNGETSSLLLHSCEGLLGTREILFCVFWIFVTGRDGKRISKSIDGFSKFIRQIVPVRAGIEQGIDVVQAGQGRGRDVRYGSHEINDACCVKIDS